MADTARAHLGLTVPVVSERLVLRRVQADDNSMLTRLWTDPEVRRYVGGPLAPEVIRQRNADFVGKPSKYCVVLRASGEAIGLLGVGLDGRTGHWEISYGILPEHWRHGYAREAIRALLAWVFERLPDVEVIVANTKADNEPSRRLLDALGAELVEYFGEHQEAVTYAIARSTI